MTDYSKQARDFGIPFSGVPGPLNAITDVPGVEVGYATLISGEGKLEVGIGPVRTGVTAILPCGKNNTAPCFGGWASLNHAGEMTGTVWLDGLYLPKLPSDGVRTILAEHKLLEDGPACDAKSK